MYLPNSVDIHEALITGDICHGFKFFKCFSGSTGFIGSTSGLFEGLFEEVTGSEVADSDVTV